MNEQNYRIGLTTQITGIRPETLRAWERRYSVVKPIRTEAGDRLYTQADIDRLLLIKRLVDNGDAISAVANLSHDTLKERTLHKPVECTHCLGQKKSGVNGTSMSVA